MTMPIATCTRCGIKRRARNVVGYLCAACSGFGFDACEADALTDGSWVLRAGVYVWKPTPAPDAAPRRRECTECGVRCRGRLCRPCWRREKTGEWTTAELQRAHSAYGWHKDRSDWACEGERVYQHRRYINKREREAA